METPSLGAGLSYSIQGAWSYLLQIGLDLRLFYWCGSTPITRKDQANMDYSRCKQILHDFYSENGIIDHFERDNLYLEKAFHEINEMWFRNLECIKEVKYLMIAEAPLWGKDKSYIYNPETKNTQFFQKKDLERVIGLNVYNKLDFLNYCNKMGLLIIDISPFAFNTEDTIINYRNKTSNNPYGLTKYQYRGLIEQTLTTFFDIKIQAISLKKSRNIKIFYRYRRVMIQFNDLIYNSFVKYDFAINENELSDISKRGGGIDGFKFRQIIF